MPLNPDGLVEFAPAKLNLFLHVGDKRADGFHALESLVVFADIGDQLRIEPADVFSLVLDGPFGSALLDEKHNLIARAAHLLAQQVGQVPNYKITLTKNLPVSSGIGGGSADAAATLRALATLWKVERQALYPLAEQLGSDIPACVTSQSLWMAGRGEILSDVATLPRAHLLLVNPGIAVPTGQIFSSLHQRSGVGQALPPPQGASLIDLIDYLATTQNDLESPARALQPAIGDVLQTIAQSGAALTRMSGSGATCFGLFADQASAETAARKIQAAKAQWWVKAGSLV